MLEERPNTNWSEIIEGGEEFHTRLEELQEGARVEVDNIVRFLKQVPADDKRKKEELAAFFQTEEGGRYNAAERKRAYDDLLGPNRNWIHSG